MVHTLSMSNNSILPAAVGPRSCTSSQIHLLVTGLFTVLHATKGEGALPRHYVMLQILRFDASASRIILMSVSKQQRENCTIVITEYYFNKIRWFYQVSRVDSTISWPMNFALIKPLIIRVVLFNIYSVSNYLTTGALLSFYHSLAYSHLEQSIIIWRRAPGSKIYPDRLIHNKILRVILWVKFYENHLPIIHRKLVDYAIWRCLQLFLTRVSSFLLVLLL